MSADEAERNDVPGPTRVRGPSWSGQSTGPRPASPLCSQVANRMSLSNSSSFCWGVSTSFFFLPSEESALNWTQRARHRLIGRGRANQKSMAQGNETRPLFFGCFFSLSLFSAASETGGIIANKSILRESRCCGANPFKGTG